MTPFEFVGLVALIWLVVLAVSLAHRGKGEGN